MVDVKAALQEQRKAALKNREKEKLSILGMIMAEIKQFEIDEQKEADAETVINILDKMLKQRRDALSQFQAAAREDKVSEATYEIDIIQTFLPAQLSADELRTIVQSAITTLGVKDPKEMSKVIDLIRPQIKGRADMRQVSEMIKQQLSN